MKNKNTFYVIIVFLAFSLAGCAKKVTLLSGLNDAQTIEVIAELYKGDIAAEKATDRQGKNSVLVDEDVLGRATLIMKASGLPQPEIDGIDALFKRDSMVSSPEEDHVRLYYGTSQELAKSLQSIDGVVSARVHIVIPEAGIDGRLPPPTAAAVMIRHRGEFKGDINKIRRLIANSVPGLSFESVSVYLFQEPAPELPVFHKNGDGWGIWIGVGVVLLLVLGALGFMFRGRFTGNASQDSTDMSAFSGDEDEGDV